MADINIEFRWSKMVQLIAGLWPEWEPSPAQRDEWKRVLAGKNPDGMEKAIRAHYGESKWREPKLPAILGHYRSMFKTEPKGDELNATVAQHRVWESEAVKAQSRMAKKLSGVDPERLGLAAEYVQLRFIADEDEIGKPIRRKQHGTDPFEWDRMMVGFVYTLLFDPPTERLRNWEADLAQVRLQRDDERQRKQGVAALFNQLKEKAVA